MSSFQIIVGSMLGGSEYVAEACEETLKAMRIFLFDQLFFSIFESFLMI